MSPILRCRVSHGPWDAVNFAVPMMRMLKVDSSSFICSNFEDWDRVVLLNIESKFVSLLNIWKYQLKFGPSNSQSKPCLGPPNCAGRFAKSRNQDGHFQPDLQQTKTTIYVYIHTYTNTLLRWPYQHDLQQKLETLPSEFMLLQYDPANQEWASHQKWQSQMTSVSD